MTEKLATLWPEIVMGIGACLCLLAGLSRNVTVRRTTCVIAGAAIVIATLIAYRDVHVEPMARYLKMVIGGVGFLLLLLALTVPEQLRQTRLAEGVGRVFDPSKALRGEFFAFFLMSLIGVMLCAGADDLIWLFLALELTSLPTYVMVAMSRDHRAACESAMKYFFLGAMAVAIFLYGFTLIYGATGLTNLQSITAHVAQSPEGASSLLITGVILAITGVAFKITAVPMHFYAADVYQGANVTVTAFLAFVPKTAGFITIILLLGLFIGPGDDATAKDAAGAMMVMSLPESITWLLWIMAAVTMTVGNVMGLLQTNVKRVLAYSSIAHSGYMLVGLVGGVGVVSGALAGDGPAALGNGAAAVLFYLVAYALATLSAFAVLAAIQVHGDEAQTYDDLSGLARKRPGLAAIMLLAVLSLIGLPPMVGFLGKIYLFGTAINHGFIGLVVIALLNSAIAAVYYLRIAAACFFGEANDEAVVTPSTLRTVSAAVAVVLALVMGVAGDRLVNAAAATQRPSRAQTEHPDSPPANTRASSNR